MVTSAGRAGIDPDHDPIDALMYRGSNKYVDTVLVNGQVVCEDGVHTGARPGKVLRHS